MLPLPLTSLGTFHTIIGILALIAGLWALVRDQRISPRNALGKTYIAATLVVSLTGFFIFQHGGFGKPHALGIITLAVLAVALLAGYRHAFGRASPYVEAVSYSATYFFHLVPTIAEGSTRLPPAAPLAASPEAPGVQLATAVAFVVFLIGAYLQVRMMRGAAAQGLGEEATI
jgi:uncharacterized membrane protein